VQARGARPSSRSTRADPARCRSIWRSTNGAT
jgi:hypothetical protein